MLRKSFLLFFSYFFLSLLIAGPDFYEGGIYLSYLKSIFADGDFNIINHVPAPMEWLVTPNFFHPAKHTEIQTPLLFLFGLLEKFSKFLTLTHHDWTSYPFAAGSLSLFSLFVGFRLTQKTAEEIGIKISQGQLLCFYFGTALFYFSFFAITVIDVSLFPALAYLAWNFFRVKKKKAIDSPWMLGVACGILVLIRPTYWVPCGYMAFLILRNKKNLSFLVPVALLVGCEVLNQFLKYGKMINSQMPILMLFHFSPVDLVVSFVKGYFFPGGMFFTNPPYFIGIIGMFWLGRDLFKKKILNGLDLSILGVWILGLTIFRTLPLIGYLVEDHLPGRMGLNVLVFLLLGFSYFISKMRLKKKQLLLWGWGLALWHLFWMISFVFIDSLNPYLYPLHLLPLGDLWSQSMAAMSQKFSVQVVNTKHHFFNILLYSALLAALITGIRLKWKDQQIMRTLALSCCVLFAAMTTLNYFNSGEKVRALTAAGFFDNKVVGAGAEIYAADFSFDGAKMLKLYTDAEGRKKIDAALSRYYDIMKGQVVRSTPWFDQMMAERSPDLSFFIRMTDGRR
ncbi:hypothetical protein K2X30_04635 [bacterium]|nr:hypothetical protein [bacterium]